MIGVKSPGQGRFTVADPRLNWHSDAHRNILAVVRVVDADVAVADAMPAAGTRLVAVIRSEDGTWHRPFTTLELAALQGLYDPDSDAGFVLEGASDSGHRERIGNAVPPAAAQAIASVIGRTLLLAWAGETFLLSSDPIWVRPVTTAVAMTGLTDGLPSC